MTTGQQEDQQEGQQEAPAAPAPADAYAETRAMAHAYRELAGLDRLAQLRALRWITDRLDADAYAAARAAGVAGKPEPYDGEPF